MCARVGKRHASYPPDSVAHARYCPELDSVGHLTVWFYEGDRGEEAIVLTIKMKRLQNPEQQVGLSNYSWQDRSVLSSVLSSIHEEGTLYNALS